MKRLIPLFLFPIFFLQCSKHNSNGQRIYHPVFDGYSCGAILDFHEDSVAFCQLTQQHMVYGETFSLPPGKYDSLIGKRLSVYVSTNRDGDSIWACNTYIAQAYEVVHVDLVPSK